MAEHRSITWALTLALLAGLAAGIVHFSRFASPAAYAVASSLRSDESGTELLFDALTREPSLLVERNYLPIDQFRAHDAVLFYLDVSAASLPLQSPDLFHRLQQIARDGNRLVVGFDTATALSAGAGSKTIRSDAVTWGVHVETSPSGTTVTPDKSWMPLPVPGLYEREFGTGSIVLVVDDSRLRNKALAAKAESRALVPVLIGSRKRVVFDESHLGIAETGSIMALARRHRLQGLLLGLALVAAFFLWNRSVSFPPPPPSESDHELAITASDSRVLLTNLLARHLAESSLVQVCVHEWTRTHPKTPLRAPRAQDPVKAYREVQQSLETPPSL